MKVTPIKRKFGRYMPGEEFELPDKVARIFVNQKKLAYVGGEVKAKAESVYQTRALVAAPVMAAPDVQVVGYVETFDSAEIGAMGAEVDATGVEWDATLHAASKLKNSDGTWRKKPGRAAV